MKIALNIDAMTNSCARVDCFKSGDIGVGIIAVNSAPSRWFGATSSNAACTSASVEVGDGVVFVVDTSLHVAEEGMRVLNFSASAVKMELATWADGIEENESTPPQSPDEDGAMANPSHNISATSNAIRVFASVTSNTSTDAAVESGVGDDGGGGVDEVEAEVELKL